MFGRNSSLAEIIYAMKYLKYPLLIILTSTLYLLIDMIYDNEGFNLQRSLTEAIIGGVLFVVLFEIVRKVDNRFSLWGN